eukprot:m.29888 g.29888  ORF g.29888 m.29888 type:complete len:334 (+) comp16173_c0_seq1:31-1032(+)
MSSSGELLVLILSNGMKGDELAGAIEGMKASSKKIGTHKGRELYWNAYTALGTAANAIDGVANCFLQYRMPADGEGVVEHVELTKRQRGLVNGGIDIVGSTKFKPPEDPTSKAWCMTFSEERAAIAWDDFMYADPCIYISPNGVYVATRHKRVLCKAINGSLKQSKDVEKIVSSVASEKPLRSVSFAGSEIPSVNGYNVILAGTAKPADLPTTIGHVSSASTNEIYDYFLTRCNNHLVGEADKLIAQMLADVSKDLLPIVSASSKKDAAIAYKSGVMKKVYVHESMKKFIDKVKSDGQVEIYVIKGDVESSDFAQYGKIVFEMFYRVDLSTYA